MFFINNLFIALCLSKIRKEYDTNLLLSGVLTGSAANAVLFKDKSEK